MSESTFRSYVRDIVESLASHGFDRVMLVNGHGENVAALRQVTGTITRNDRRTNDMDASAPTTYV